MDHGAPQRILAHMAERGRRDGALLLFFFYPAMAIAFFETLRLPWAQILEHFSALPLFVQVWIDYFQNITTFLIRLAIIQVAAFVVAMLSCHRKVLLIVAAIAAGAVSMFAIYQNLTSYTPFAGYPPFIAALIGLGAMAATCIFLVFWRFGNPAKGRRLRWLIGGGALANGGLTLLARHTIAPDQYPTLHLSLLALTFLLFLWGSLAIASNLKDSILRSRLAVVLLSGAVVIALGALGVDVHDSMPQPIQSYTISMSEVKSWNLYGEKIDEQPLSPPQDCEQDTVLSEQEARELFFRKSGYPRLDESLNLDELNVLLIVLETTRFDDTSLDASTELGTTPNLMRLVERGGFSFVNAHAPSSNTLQVTGSLMTMAPPSSSPLTIDRQRSWRGRLRSEKDTVAEYFRDMGHHTFRSVHYAFEYLTGFGQGFDDSFVVERHGSTTDAEFAADIDDQITESALEFLDISRREDEPFFGWLFYYSPHHPYVVRNPEGDTSERGRYRQEIHYVDAHVGRILDYLDDHQLWDETMVIVTSDHGEEFGDHGNTHHGKNLHRASLHIPLVVWIPPVNGHHIEDPVSLSYLFSWLFLHAQTEASTQLIDQVQKIISPSLVATEGAVISELTRGFGGHQGWVSLTWADQKLIHQIDSGYTQFYDITDDPWEQNDLFLSQSDAVQRSMQRLSRYLDFRQCYQRFQVLE